MSSTAESFTSFRFSTRDIPPTQRLSRWNDAAFSSPLPRRILSPPLASDGSFHVEMAGHAIGSGSEAGICLMGMRLTPGGRAQRTAALLADGNDDVILQIHQAGGRTVSQLGREATVGTGTGLLTSNSDTSTIVLPGPARFISIAVPRKLMTALAPGVEDAFLRPLPSDTGVLRLLVKYLDVVDDDLAEWPADLRHAIATHIHDLCALAVGATRDAAEIANRRGLRAARLQAIKADIAEHLGDMHLRATTIALRQGVTPRYIHKLFEGEGVTLSEFVRRQRMTAVHRMLTDPRHSHRTIGSIAYEAGFGDLSTFNREFRRLFAATPSDVRTERRHPIGRKGSG
jgi:AraC-like DNA-binding protein